MRAAKSYFSVASVRARTTVSLAYAAAPFWTNR